MTYCNCFVVPGLNHNGWHEVTVELDTVTGNLSVNVDGQGSKVKTLKAFLDGGAEKILTEGGSRRTGILSIGGNENAIA